MDEYNCKVVDFGYKKTFFKYAKTIDMGYETYANTKRTRYADMTDREQKKSDDRRLKYYRRMVRETIEISMMNDDLDNFITLTFANPVTSYDIAVEEWKLFLKRLRYYYPDREIRYICVWELQKNRGDVYHFHVLTNLGYIEHSLLEKIWKKGYVFIRQLGSQEDRKRSILYCTKYLVKEITEQLENEKDTRGMRFIFTSNNLLRPISEKLKTDKQVEDVIFEHMEDIIRDGSFDMQTDRGKIINHVSFVEYITESTNTK